jgi:hypothetical protein
MAMVNKPRIIVRRSKRIVDSPKHRVIHPAVMVHLRHVWIETTAIRRIIRHGVDPNVGYAGRRIEDDALAQDSLENLNQAGSRRDALK